VPLLGRCQVPSRSRHAPSVSAPGRSTKGILDGTLDFMGLNDYLEQRLAAARWRVGSGSPPESRRAGRLAIRRGLPVRPVAGRDAEPADPMHVEARLRAVRHPRLQRAFEISFTLRSLSRSIFAWTVTGPIANGYPRLDLEEWSGRRQAAARREETGVSARVRPRDRCDETARMRRVRSGRHPRSQIARAIESPPGRGCTAPPSSDPDPCTRPRS